MLVQTADAIGQETRQKQPKEFNRLKKITDVKAVCANAYIQGSNETLLAADTTCKKTINNLSYSNKNKFCLDKNQKIEDILRSEAVNEEIVEHAVHVLKRFCDSYAMTRVQTICARRSLNTLVEFTKEKKKANNRRCRNAINGLSNENKQKFCSANKDRDSRAVIKRICDAFIDNINAVTNYKCIAPYLDTMWYDASEEVLSEIDSNCRQAIENLYGENKKNFCNNYEENITDKGSLLTREGTLDDKTKHRAVNVVKEACSSFFHRVGKREINKVMEEIKMENAANGIPEVIELASSQSINGLIPKNRSLGWVNYNKAIASSLKNETKGIQAEQSLSNNNLLETSIVTVGVLGGFLGFAIGASIWARKKWQDRRDAGLESQMQAKQMAYLKL